VAATLHKLTAGDGYLYLIRQVAASDSTERGRNTLSEYYSAKGESPGHWVGTGLASLSSTETVSGARGHRIGVGDLIITRRNDASIELRNANDAAAEANPVRNGNRWRVTALDAKTNRLAARRIDDNTMAVFTADYVREHIAHGYAVTVHSAQGGTADTTHAVLGKATTRSMLYVAMTRGRDNNTAYFYERTAEQEYRPAPHEGLDLMRRGTSHRAAQLARAIVGNHDPCVTAHDIAAQTASAALPERIRGLLQRREAAVHQRHTIYDTWQAQARSFAIDMAHCQERGASRSREQGVDCGLDL
jgi:UvrD-like helicase C-terminal domain